jgi:hypothetical protein
LTKPLPLLPLQDGSTSVGSSGPRALSGLLPQEDTLHERSEPASPGLLEPSLEPSMTAAEGGAAAAAGLQLLLL